MKVLSNKEKYVFTSEMEIILKGGIDIESGLSMMQEHATTENLKEVCMFLKEQVAIKMLHEGIEDSHVFDAYMEKMVEIGEMNGQLDSVMESLRIYYAHDQKLNESIKEATTYPVLLLCMMSIIVAILVFKVVPIFEEVMEGMGTTYSSFAYMMIQISKVCSSLCFVGFVVFFLILFGLYMYAKVKHISDMKERVMMKFFLTKKLVWNMSVARFTYALSLFISSGYPMDTTLRFMPSFITHPLLKKKVEDMVVSLEKEESFMDSLQQSHIYDGMYNSMLMIAFESGKENEVLAKLQEIYEQEVETSITHFLNILEPMMILILSVVVGLILLSIMLPLMGILSSLG